MRHKGANPAHVKANGPVVVRKATKEELKIKPRAGKTFTGYIKSSREVGDLRTVFTHEYVAFKGGEGGRNWSVSGTTDGGKDPRDLGSRRF